jgi:hypothetical protein
MVIARGIRFDCSQQHDQGKAWGVHCDKATQQSHAAVAACVCTYTVISSPS